MRNAALIFILFGFSSIGLGQNSSSSGKGKIALHWNESDAHELDYKKTIATTKELGPDEKQALTEAIAAQMRPFKADRGIASESELQKLAEQTRIKLVDLNDDGIPEVLAQAVGFKAGCGATGNCSFWVFKKAPAGYMKILDSRGEDGYGGIEVIKISTSHSNGYKDLILGDHVSAAERTLYVYRYRNGKYQESECYDANWVIHKNEKRYELKTPELTPCSEESQNQTMP
jgi:hypothetical protein